MKIDQFYKKLNASELGKMGTNETYISIPRETNLDEFFPDTNETYIYKDIENKKEHKLILRELTNEYRVTGLGPFYRDNDMNPGDKVHLEKQTNEEGEETYVISTSPSEAQIVLQLSTTYGFRILNEVDPNILGEDNTYNVQYKGNIERIKLVFLENVRPRKNSSRAYDFYDLNIGGTSVRTDFKNNDIIEILIEDSTCLIINNPLYKKQTIKY